MLVKTLLSSPLVSTLISGGLVSLKEDTRRNYFYPDGIDDYIDLPSIPMRTGQIFKFKFKAPTSVVSRQSITLIGHSTYSNAADFGFGDNGKYGINNRISVRVDGVSVSVSDFYPLDGKTHTVELISSNYAVISRIHNRFDFAFPSYIPIWDVEVLGSDKGALFFPLDDGYTPEGTIRETLQGLNGTLRNGQKESWKLE